MTETVLPDKTYTEVFGKKVMASESVPSGLSKPGRPIIYFKGVVKLLLDDGSETYGCKWCGKFVDDKLGRMRIHHRAYCDVRPKSEIKKTGKPRPPEMTQGWKRDPDGTTYVGVKEQSHNGTVGVENYDVRITPKTVFGGSGSHEPPPSDVTDILAALSALNRPDAKEVANLRAQVDQKDRVVRTVTNERDRLQAKVVRMEGELVQIRALLTELKIIS